MVNDDTIKLLKETNAGIKMGVSSINDCLEYVSDEQLKTILADYKKKHENLGDETRAILNQYHDEGKEPNPIAKGMSWLKTNISMTLHESDQTIADLITDGCNMGIKSLNKYMNKYKAAEQNVIDIAERLCDIENAMAHDLKKYL